MTGRRAVVTAALVLSATPVTGTAPQLPASSRPAGLGPVSSDVAGFLAGNVRRRHASRFERRRRLRAGLEARARRHRASNVRSQHRAPAPAASSAVPAVWARLAGCESGGDWSIDTGNGYSGGLQFSASTWAANGGLQYAPSAAAAPAADQVLVAERVLAASGWSAWPACSAMLGLR